MSLNVSLSFSSKKNPVTSKQKNVRFMAQLNTVVVQKHEAIQTMLSLPDDRWENLSCHEVDNGVRCCNTKLSKHR